MAWFAWFYVCTSSDLELCALSCQAIFSVCSISIPQAPTVTCAKAKTARRESTPGLPAQKHAVRLHQRTLCLVRPLEGHRRSEQEHARAEHGTTRSPADMVGRPSWLLPFVISGSSFAPRLIHVRNKIVSETKLHKSRIFSRTHPRTKSSTKSSGAPKLCSTYRQLRQRSLV